ncbi:mandelate racemase/muconate lactonizing enzyme family protein [Natronobacterium gregoryi]|uniref:o-succinylbenzoate synthase n=2 Tax=Natronobacterium gregoryi TaxID=44930 RepID=L0AE97_NATGS|nr:o-succinylbenzoate synthase [Natronobacterium gregoryi]AFZ71472.1 enolase superfamily enzyme related to L-alanine-DL-glutamate epimerase [Natronobacterium gregoryi SP2]ELY66774.1 mandelate racemase [Natronobacterium gregoryi SP2]PLK19934.1 o-succinylbenzoate synthase [Natronobacterium gregoryi SP2]SFJ36508.1 o-succinylbenzoate synthase [Natronobacterium gregoryi]
MNSNGNDRSASALELEIRSFSLPLEQPLGTAGGSIESRDGFLVRVVDRTVDEPTATSVGYGEATPLAGWTESPDDCEAALERARTAIRSGGPSGALGEVDEQVAARHAVSLALADLKASQSATPLYRHLGQESMVGRVPVNATIGDGTPDESARTAMDAVERGFTCCKLKAGLRDLEEDVARVRRVREMVGSDVELRVDANEAWTYAEAERALEAFDELDVSVLEQPLPAGALEGHADLREAAGEVEIALDEGVLEHGIDGICSAGAADVVVLKPMALGGVDVAYEVAAWVSELEITPLVTTTIDGAVARTGAVHLAAAIPDVPACGLATAELLAEDLGRDPVVLENGAAVIPQAKGLGIDGVWPD